MHVSDEQFRRAEAFVAKARANDRLAPVDLDRFWADQEKACSDPWADDCPQVPMGIGMNTECVFDELGVEEDYRRLEDDEAWRLELCRRYNDRAEAIVGRRLLGETKNDPTLYWPRLKGLHDIFEAENKWIDRSWWLQQAADTPDELAALLDRVEKRLEDLRAFLLPDNWESEKERLTGRGAKVPLYRGQRGPITFAMSVYGVENLVFLIADLPDLAARFRDLMLRAVLERARVLDEEAGHTPETAPRGWNWCDDNCAMLNADMYGFFGAPILKGVFDRHSPGPNDMRGQHSDSDMAHLLPQLGTLGLTWTNFGPTLTVTEIRRHIPGAVIRGQLAPFTFSRDEEVNIVAELLRDHAMAREKKGLVFETAGSTNNGSRLTGMRLIMGAIQEFGRYDR
jgi:uroporphyrinogen decarboxylase